MATHSSIPAWEIPWTEEPGGYRDIAGKQAPYRWGFPDGVSVIKTPPANAGDTKDMGSIPGSGRSSGEGNDNHSSILAWEILPPRGAWEAIVHAVAKSQTQVSTHIQTDIDTYR